MGGRFGFPCVWCGRLGEANGREKALFSFVAVLKGNQVFSPGLESTSKALDYFIIGRLTDAIGKPFAGTEIVFSIPVEYVHEQFTRLVVFNIIKTDVVAECNGILRRHHAK